MLYDSSEGAVGAVSMVGLHQLLPRRAPPKSPRSEPGDDQLHSQVGD